MAAMMLMLMKFDNGCALLNFISITSLQPFFGCHLCFHNFFHPGFLRLHLFSQLGCIYSKLQVLIINHNSQLKQATKMELGSVCAWLSLTAVFWLSLSLCLAQTWLSLCLAQYLAQIHSKLEFTFSFVPRIKAIELHVYSNFCKVCKINQSPCMA